MAVKVSFDYGSGADQSRIFEAAVEWKSDNASHVWLYDGDNILIAEIDGVMVVEYVVAED